MLNFSQGQIAREPGGASEGYWAGAPGAFYAADEAAWYLTYRIRRPRGAEPDRGGEARIARSTDLRKWEDIWSVNKSEYGTASIERSALHKGPDKLWRYITSYVDPADGRWCVALVRGKDPRAFRAGDGEKILTAAPLGLEGIKDPWITQHQGRYHMFLSVATATPKTTGQSHASLDIYNTGECVSATGLATSDDLERWEWQGVIFGPDKNGWDGYCRRINSVVESKGRFIGFYDGSASHKENYEEKTGIAAAEDFRSWRTLTPDGPAYVSPNASHSLRYIDAQSCGDEMVIFYEFARADGAHDLRVLRMPRVEFDSSFTLPPRF
jgi:hypothetical protein